ncbi:TadE/TadG family type IV pilus assembly protein [Phreatobacter cathodiphilus]|uniref:Pilus assembly protein TadG n=1 Tax=Phreatobacter cathodiphilus TaxID=1868589 RepID=A0A2S0N8K0_9HYPH|nr:pilus assembly protein TadG-related protein [Phreatobacter cathodiphilus]AVO44468.1 pilus assembly protein TadG [Phreatobacter cathodiphilus]
MLARPPIPDVLSRLRRDAGGSIAITFAICLVAIFGFVGLAVDYSRGARVQAKLQSALDAAAVAASSRASGKTGDQIKSDALTFFAAQFKEAGVPTPTIVATVTDSTLELKATLALPANFLPVIGINSVDVAAASKTAWGITRLRVALALDNTGSMSSSGKMSALKTATLSLLTQLQDNAKNDGDVLVSLVPFAKVVNVGTTYRNASWIRMSDATVCSWIFCSSSWSGAIQDRDKNNDISNAAPSGSSTYFPAMNENYTGGTPTAIQPLTSNWGQLRSTVAQMSPAGNTNQVIGLAWAWQTLTQGLPMNAPAEDPKYTYKKVIILISDGLNTESRHADRQSEIDSRQTLLCTAIKAAGITLYTIQVNTGGDATSSVMQNCASTSDKFTLMTNPTQLVTTLSDIGGQLTRLRLTN